MGPTDWRSSCKAWPRLWSCVASRMYILASVRLVYGVRVGVEAAATVAKSGVTLGLLRAGTAPALAFSWGQLAYAAVTLLGYCAYFGREWAWHRHVPCYTGGEEDKAKEGLVELDPGALRISRTFAVQAAGKLVLAEGGKAVLAAASDGAAQGVYGLVTNLGSLLVRTLFQPYQEAAFAAFSRAAGERGAGAKARRAALLSLLCRAICLLGACAAAFGPAYARIALRVLYGACWAESGAAPALGVYSGYVALLAVNGILEAFVHATADAPALHRANAALAVISVIHLALSVAGVGVCAGAICLLLAVHAGHGAAYHVLPALCRHALSRRAGLLHCEIAARSPHGCGAGRGLPCHVRLPYSAAARVVQRAGAFRSPAYEPGTCSGGRACSSGTLCCSDGGSHRGGRSVLSGGGVHSVCERAGGGDGAAQAACRQDRLR